MSRNLLEYPITGGEVLDNLIRAINDYTDKGWIGGNQGYILHMIKDTLAARPEMMAAVVEACRVKV